MSTIDYHRETGPRLTNFRDATDWNRYSSSNTRHLAVKNIQKCQRQLKQVTEAVEAEVDEVPRKFHHLATDGFVINKYTHTLLLASCTNM